MSNFKCCHDLHFRGFQMTFENGWTISVQFGEGNYAKRIGNSSAYTAECAVWDANGKWHRLTEYDDVRGHMTADEVGQLIQEVMTFKPVEKV